MGSVLVAIDFEEKSHQALCVGARVAKQRREKLIVLHCVDLPSDPAKWSYFVERSRISERNLQKEAIAKIDDFCRERLTDEDCPAHYGYSVKFSPPADGIVETARQKGSSLVVVGGSGGGALRHFVLGSVAEEVVRASEIPTLIVPSKSQLNGVERVVAPVDFSECSRRSLQQAVDWSRRWDARLEVVHAYEAPAGFGAFGLAPTPDEMERLRERRGGELDELVEEVGVEGVEAQVRLERGKPHEVILEAVSGEAGEMIVMGTHGHRGLRRFFIGSEATRVLRAAPCPTVTVRAGDDDG
jgi:nucleotide-binding universal stress UspA family protein